MRISDWSSDVCSSDLLEAETGLATGWKNCGSLAVARTADRMTVLKRTAAAERAQGVDIEMISPSEEIGRASCRERVCQYVSISVVAVSLKKKQVRAELTRSAQLISVGLLVYIQ